MAVASHSSVQEGIFVNLGYDEAARQSLFFHLSRHLVSDGIFYDSTTVSTYSENLTEARYGFNKDQDGLPTFKILTFYSRNKRCPLAFSLQPGNIPDQISVSNALKELDFLHIDRYIVVTDNGFCTESSLTAYLRSNTKYLSLIAADRQWIKPLVEKALPELETLSTINEQHADIHQYATSVFHEFSWRRERGRGEKVKGDLESVKRRVYVHVFRSDSRTRNASDAFRDELLVSRSALRLARSLRRQIRNAGTHFSMSLQSAVAYVVLSTRKPAERLFKAKARSCLKRDQRFYRSPHSLPYAGVDRGILPNNEEHDRWCQATSMELRGL